MTQQLTTIDTFKQQMTSGQVQSNLHEFLPDGKALKKFTAVTIRAVQENPDLLNADRKSLFLACQRAAQDGLMPDGREGALVLYNTNIGTKEKPKWVQAVQYQPMIAGLRKKMAQAGFDLRAEIVHENDEFTYESGDDPKIVHRPNVFGDRGKIVGAYAIATELETGQKWRETMSVAELETVRAMAKGGNSPAWKNFTTEMYRKTVAKRLRKYLPISDDSLLDLIDRDNEQFDLDQRPQPSRTAQEVQAAVRAGNDEPLEGEIVEQEQEPKPEKKVKKKPEPEPEPVEEEEYDEEDDPLA